MLLPMELAGSLLVDVEALAQSLSVSAANLSTPPQAEPQKSPDSQSMPTSFTRKQESKIPPIVALASQPEEVQRTVRVDLDEMDQVVHGVTESMVQLLALQSSMSTLDRALALSNALSLHLGGTGAALDAQQRHTRIAGIADSLGNTLTLAHRELSAHADQLERELTSLQESTAHLRLASARGLFIPMERVAVSAAQQLGKQIRFTASGGDMRIDSQLLAAVRDPLLHVVRNAVAHGIELPAERMLQGKSPEGRISVLVERRGNQVAFICHDDGRGIDLDVVRSIAIQRGFLTAEQAASVSEEELLALTMRPGFTTEERVNQIAGRGIGLDAVAAALEQLHGAVQIRSRKTVGTTVELTAPAALLVTEVVFAEAAGKVVALPSDSIRQTMRVLPKEIVNEFGHEKLISDGSLIPYFSVSQALGAAMNLNTHVALLLESQGRRAAVGVDRLRGTGTLVSRPLPTFLLAESYISSIALDAQGTPQLILDPAGLVATALEHIAPTVASGARPLPVLIVDDSLTTRMLEQSILEAAGFDVDTAVNAEEALVKARQREYGLFLVDVEMPGMNGFEFVELTRADEQLGQVPAILVTSRSSPEDRARGRAVGASDYVIKSEFDQGYLLDRIRQMVRSAQL
jgi:two-component system chemotaxis sensor kinase CheA